MAEFRTMAHEGRLVARELEKVDQTFLRRGSQMFKEVIIRLLIVFGLIALALIRAFNNILRRS